MNWQEATREQLIDIAIIDTETAIEYRIAAAVELKRRARQEKDENTMITVITA